MARCSVGKTRTLFTSSISACCRMYAAAAAERVRLELLRARGKTIILEIDPPVDDISRRRKGFYERNGFIANDYDYTHLPYHRDCKGHRLIIMSSPRRIDEAEYNNFLDYMRRRVMVF